MKNTLRGFTLIELMIVTVVIAVLASVAYPSYSEYVAKSRRTAVTAILSQGQQFMERFYTENFSYYQVRGSTAVVADVYPGALTQSPPKGEGAASYTVAVTVDAKQPEIYTLKATRTGGMVADRCGNYQVDQYGRKTLDGYDTQRFASSKAAMDYCWK
mgnify:CR=1 FL=1